ncbi:MAG TPA: hypothetical protein VF190_06630 [Rhodothermales bacterium]
MTQVQPPLPLPLGTDLPAGYVIRVNAIDPTTGAQVTGVTVTDFSLLVGDVAGTLDVLVGNPILIGINA